MSSESRALLWLLWGVRIFGQKPNCRIELDKAEWEHLKVVERGQRFKLSLCTVLRVFLPFIHFFVSLSSKLKVPTKCNHSMMSDKVGNVGLAPDLYSQTHYIGVLEFISQHYV